MPFHDEMRPKFVLNLRSSLCWSFETRKVCRAIGLGGEPVAAQIVSKIY